MITMADCTAVLQKKDLWTEFHQLDTEMIITKTGRRMFPTLRVQLYQLDPTARYCVLLEMIPIGNCRYKYSASTGWGPAGAEEAQSPHRVYLHPESPATGEQWMSQPISFGRVKLTNTPAPPLGHLVLSSMHKYQPRILIVKAVDPRAIAWAHTESIVFPETQFIAVTAYQNERITKLKIDHNPFAKGFRANGHSKCKRKRSMSESQETSPEEDSRKTSLPPVETASRVAEMIRSEPVLSTPTLPVSSRPTLPVYPNYYPCANYSPQSLYNYYLSYCASAFRTNPYPPPLLLEQNAKLASRRFTDFSIASLINK